MLTLGLVPRLRDAFVVKHTVFMHFTFGDQSFDVGRRNGVQRILLLSFISYPVYPC